MFPLPLKERNPPLFCTRRGVGTTLYTAPEIRAEELGLGDIFGPDPQYTVSIDMWSVGVIFFEILAGRCPFEHADEDALKEYVRGSEPFPEMELVKRRVSLEARDLIKKLMMPQPNQRISAREAMRHKLFRKAPLSSQLMVQAASEARLSNKGGIYNRVVDSQGKLISKTMNTARFGQVVAYYADELRKLNDHPSADWLMQATPKDQIEYIQSLEDEI
jgi:serine/threonine protein kinase